MRNSLKSGLVSLLGASALLLGSSCNKPASYDVYDNLNDKESANYDVYDNLNDKDVFGLSKDGEKVGYEEDVSLVFAYEPQKRIYRNQKDLLKPDRFIKDFPDRTIYFKKQDKGVLYNLIILEESDQGTREFRAETAEIEGGEDSAVFLSMHNVRISPYASGASGVASVDRLKYLLPDLSLTFSNNNSQVSD